YVIGENPAQSEADQTHATHLLEGLDHLVVQDIVMTKTCELAHVVLPAAVGFCEADGTGAHSERRVQRVRRALAPPGYAWEDARIVLELARHMGHDWGLLAPDGSVRTEAVWDELRRTSPMHGGMSYARLAEGGLQWPCYDEQHPGEL